MKTARRHFNVTILGSGTCVPSSADCGLNACQSGTCSSSCTTDAECSGGAYCSAGACVEKDADGEPCTEGRTCMSTFCSDGVCCDSACTGQCEACNLTASVGKCSGVNGEPQGDRDPCPGASGTDPCTARVCNGDDDRTIHHAICTRC